MADPQVDNIDDAIIATIDVLRAKHRACTARLLANTLGYHHTYISKRLGLLRERGLVGFDPVIPGSIHRVGSSELGPPSPAGMTWSEMVKVAQGDTTIEPVAEMTPAQQRAAHARAVAAERRAAATS